MLVVDRFEDGFAVCETTDGDKSETLLVELRRIPEDTREGDVIYEAGEIFERDEAATKARREEILSLQESLWE